MKNFENNLETVKSLSVEKMDNGDTIWIGGLPKENLVDMAQNIFRKLEPRDNMDYQQVLLSGEAIRPCGAFSIVLTSRRGKNYILVQNKNAIGIQSSTNKLLEAVDSVCVEIK